VAIGINNVTTLQAALQTKGEETEADGHMYGLSAATSRFRARAPR
jgi:hypothetical protein